MNYIVLYFISKSMIHFGLLFVKAARSVSRLLFYFIFASGHTVVPASLIERTIFAPSVGAFVQVNCKIPLETM